MPDVYVYPVDVNKINIEFSTLNPNTFFDIEIDERKVLTTIPIQELVYSFNYDFNTDFTIKIWNLTNWYNKDIIATDLTNKLDIEGNEYIYLTDNTLYSNKRNIEGEYLNIYNGKALSTDKKIYDITTMEEIEKQKETLQLLDEQIPFTRATFNDMKIETYGHCSKVIDEQKDYTYQNKQIFIKNGLMFMIDGTLQSKGNGVIIDSYNDNQFETILGTDNRLYDLLSKIKYPKDFKNEKILEITSNVDNDNNIILAYYTNGLVCGFNYITGEEVFNNNVKEEKIGFISYITNSLRKDANLLYDLKAEDYKGAQKLKNKLEKVSVEEAITKLDINNTNNQTNNTSDNSKDTINNNKNNANTNSYATMYDTKAKEYVVYSTYGLSETKMTSENDRINEDKELVKFYSNLSTGKLNIKQIGIQLIIITISIVCIMLTTMYIRIRKRDR